MFWDKYAANQDSEPLLVPVQWSHGNLHTGWASEFLMHYESLRQRQKIWLFPIYDHCTDVNILYEKNRDSSTELSASDEHGLEEMAELHAAATTVSIDQLLHS